MIIKHRCCIARIYEALQLNCTPKNQILWIILRLQCVLLKWQIIINYKRRMRMRWEMRRILTHKTSWWFKATELKSLNYMSATLLLLCKNYVSKSMVMKMRFWVNYLHTGSRLCVRCCRCCSLFCLFVYKFCILFYFNMSFKGLPLNEILQSALYVVRLPQVYDEDGPIHSSIRGAWTAYRLHSTDNTM